jgi:hypothetical protein
LLERLRIVLLKIGARVRCVRRRREIMRYQVNELAIAEEDVGERLAAIGLPPVDCKAVIADKPRWLQMSGDRAGRSQGFVKLNSQLFLHFRLV